MYRITLREPISIKGDTIKTIDVDDFVADSIEPGCLSFQIVARQRGGLIPIANVLGVIRIEEDQKAEPPTPPEDRKVK